MHAVSNLPLELMHAICDMHTPHLTHTFGLGSYEPHPTHTCRVQCVHAVSIMCATYACHDQHHPLNACHVRQVRTMFNTYAVANVSVPPSAHILCLDDVLTAHAYGSIMHKSRQANTYTYTYAWSNTYTPCPTHTRRVQRAKAWSNAVLFHMYIHTET